MKVRRQFTDLDVREFEAYLESLRTHITTVNMIDGMRIEGEAMPIDLETLRDFESTCRVHGRTNDVDKLIEFLAERLEPRTYTFEGNGAFSSLGWYYKPIIEVCEHTEPVKIYNHPILRLRTDASEVHKLSFRRSYYAADPYTGKSKKTGSKLHDRIKVSYLTK